jgi:hypothetical protein
VSELQNKHIMLLSICLFAFLRGVVSSPEFYSMIDLFLFPQFYVFYIRSILLDTTPVVPSPVIVYCCVLFVLTLTVFELKLQKGWNPRYTHCS